MYTPLSLFLSLSLSLSLSPSVRGRGPYSSTHFLLRLQAVPSCSLLLTDSLSLMLSLSPALSRSLSLSLSLSLPPSLPSLQGRLGGGGGHLLCRRPAQPGPAQSRLFQSVPVRARPGPARPGPARPRSLGRRGSTRCSGARASHRVPRGRRGTRESPSPSFRPPFLPSSTFPLPPSIPAGDYAHQFQLSHSWRIGN